MWNKFQTWFIMLLAAFVVIGYFSTMHVESITGLNPKGSIQRFAPPVVEYEYFPKAAAGGEKRKKILITGGAGFIGSQLGYQFHQLGHEVTLLDNMKFGYRDNLMVDGKQFGRFVLGDARDPVVIPFLQGMDVVFHFAALTALPVCQSNPAEAMDVNVAGVANILEGARKFGVGRFIFASTSAVYENSKQEYYSEDIAVNPHLIYSLSKYQAELLVNSVAKVYDLDAVILRFFNVYGPHQDFRRKSPPFTSYVIRELLNKRVPVLHSDGKQERDYVYISDLLALALKAMDAPEAKGETFNVATGRKYSVNQMYDIIANALDSKIRPVYQSADHFWDAYPELFEGKKPIKREVLVKEVNKITAGSYAKAEKLLGWKPKVTMEEGLKRMVEHVQKSQAENMKSEKFSGGWKPKD